MVTAALLPDRVRQHLIDVERACVRTGHPPVSLIVFGSAAKGGFSEASDVDLIVVVRDETTESERRRVSDAIGEVEIANGFRPLRAATSAFQRRVERAAGHLFPCCVCTRADLLSGDAARVLGLRRWEAPFLDRIVFASIIAAATTASGDDLLPRLAVPPIRRVDVLKSWFGLSSRIVLSANTFLVLADATRYAMAALKHSAHSCFFCYHGRTVALEEEIEFFERRLGPQPALRELVALRRAYHPSFLFVLRCAPAIARLHFATARDFARRGGSARG